MKFDDWLKQCHRIMKKYRKPLLQHVRFWCFDFVPSSSGAVFYKKKCFETLDNLLKLYDELPLTPKTFTLYRAISQREKKSILHYSIPIPTSFTKKMPMNWIKNKRGSACFLLKIIVPKGSKIIPIAHEETVDWINKTPWKGFYENRYIEQEFLLYPGKLQILRKNKHSWTCKYHNFTKRHNNNNLMTIQAHTLGNLENFIWNKKLWSKKLKKQINKFRNQQNYWKYIWMYS